MSVVFFIATCTAVYADYNIGYHSNGYYAERSVIVLVDMEDGSLSPFIYAKYFSFMTKTAKNCTSAQGASNATLAHETGKSPLYTKGQYSYLKGRYNRALRQLAELQTTHARTLNEIETWKLKFYLAETRCEVLRMSRDSAVETCDRFRGLTKRIASTII
ncbi:MAG: hypothetical protein LBV41_08830 [Cytophagaceae bacterium]|nr:hypothetical protein [Cytophagaceae bacterium]